MNLDEKCTFLKDIALDRGFTMEWYYIGNVAVISFLDEGNIGMDLEVSATDIVVPFVRLAQYADESFAEFSLEILGIEFKKENAWKQEIQ